MIHFFYRSLENERNDEIGREREKERAPFIAKIKDVSLTLVIILVIKESYREKRNEI